MWVKIFDVLSSYLWISLCGQRPAGASGQLQHWDLGTTTFCLGSSLGAAPWRQARKGAWNRRDSFFTNCFSHPELGQAAVSWEQGLLEKEGPLLEPQEPPVPLKIDKWEKKGVWSVVSRWMEIGSDSTPAAWGSGQAGSLVKVGTQALSLTAGSLGVGSGRGALEQKDPEVSSSHE